MQTTPAEELIELGEAIALIPGRRVHRSTAIRWLTRGINGVRLRGVKCGGRWLTTAAWVSEFLRRVTADARGEAVPEPIRGEPAASH